MRKLLLLIVLIGFRTTFGQQAPDSCNLKISLLTCSPGEDLYSVFGHSALRLQDPATGTDIIFNYGTFDFDDPGFYTKFVRGKLLYFVSISKFESFYYSYQYENRSILEQELSLTCEEKASLQQALQLNLREENRYYLYHFFFDNCSTRLRDILEENTADSLIFRRIIPERAPTFRNMIHEYLESGGQYWSKLGIDLLLGSSIDRQVTNEEAMFLPDYLMKGFDSGYIKNRPLVGSKKEILSSTRAAESSAKWFRPVIATSLLLLVFGALQFLRRPQSRKILDVFDRVYFISLGLIGCVILFMWFGTDHDSCRSNFNLLWALPTHIVPAFFINSGKRWVKNYFRVMAVWYFLLFFGWALIPQDMNTAFAPLVVLAFIRSYSRFRNISDVAKKKH